MTLGWLEITIVVAVAVLLFGPALLLWWGGYAAGRRAGRSEAPPTDETEREGADGEDTDAGTDGAKEGSDD